MTRPVRVGTRGSRLALAQAEWVSDQLIAAHPGTRAEIVVLKTQGDKLQHLSLAKLDDKGFFTREIEIALLAGEVDLAVHSLKDLPTEAPEGLVVAAIPRREDSADLLIIHQDAVDDGAPIPLRAGAVVGTSSLRRQVQLASLRPDLALVEIRGNVPTRVERVRERRVDAVVLAAAGVSRLNLDLGDLRVCRLEGGDFVSAPGQGALGLQVRAEDEGTRALLQALHDPEVAECVETERELLARVGGGCNLPLGARCTRSESALVLEVAMGSRAWSPGEAVVIQRIEVCGDSPREVAERAFASLQTEAADSPEPTARVLLTATESVAARQARSLRALGLAVVSAPLLRTVSVADNQAMDAAVASLTADSWLLFASGTGVRTFFDRISETALPLGLHCGAIGSATGDLLVEHGLSADFIPEITTSEGFVAEFPACQEGAVPGHFLLPRAEGGREVMAEALRARGHRVEELVTYRSEAVQDEDLASLLAMDYDFVVFSSPSGVEAYIERVGEGVPTAPRWVSLGATTTARLRKEGFTEVLQLARPTPECLAQEILEQVALGDAGS